jgi:hypothetical protein
MSCSGTCCSAGAHSGPPFCDALITPTTLLRQYRRPVGGHAEASHCVRPTHTETAPHALQALTHNRKASTAAPKFLPKLRAWNARLLLVDSAAPRSTTLSGSRVYRQWQRPTCQLHSSASSAPGAQGHSQRACDSVSDGDHGTGCTASSRDVHAPARRVFTATVLSAC